MVAGTRGRTQIKRRLCAGGILAALAAIVLAAPTSAGPRRAGDLDPSFGDHGLRVVRKVNDAARAVAIGRKNRIVVAGSKTVVRLRPSGRLDRSFADGGIARLESVQGKLHTFYATSSSSLALDPRGSIFVVGHQCGGDTGCAFAVTHLRRDGDLDRSFGEDGIARVDFANPETYSSSIAIARGGRLIVAGRTCTYPPYDCNLALARLDRNGHLDRSFGDRGEVIVPVGRGGDCRHSGQGGEDNPMALDSRGRIVMAADCAFHQLSVARFRPSGHLDRSFARRGEVNRRVRLEWVGALAIDSHDRIDVA